jgi:hypothetical protein
MKCEIVRWHGVTQGEVFTYFHTVAIKVKVVCGIDSLACQDEFSVNDLLDVNENYEHALDCFSPVSPFSFLVSSDFSVGRTVALSQGHNHKSSSHH